jgi:hypothetical protein
MFILHSGKHKLFRVARRFEKIDRVLSYTPRNQIQAISVNWCWRFDTLGEIQTHGHAPPLRFCVMYTV